MTLIQCSECKAEMSDTANACPKCGWQKKSRFKWTTITTILAIAALIAIWNNVGGVSDVAFKWMPSVKQRITVKQALFDPESAVFRNERQSRVNKIFWCGEVNAKNLMGGNAGFHRYVVDLTGYSPEHSSAEAIIEGVASGSRFNVFWEGYCN